jgi:hypothetical protein
MSVRAAMAANTRKLRLEIAEAGKRGDLSAVAAPRMAHGNQ